MKRHQRQWIIATFLVTSISATAVEGPTLPTDWFQVVDETTSEKSSMKNSRSDTFRKPSSEFEQSTEALLDHNAMAFESLDSNAEQDSKWHLHSIMQDLAVSAQGILGMLAMKGTAAVSLYWKRRKHEPLVVDSPLNDSNSSVNDVIDLSGVTSEDLTVHLRPVIRVAMSSGKIKNENRLRKALTEKVGNFLQIAHVVESLDEHQWQVSKLRLDLSVAGSGTIIEGIQVGGALRFRFEWQPGRRKTPTGSPMTALHRKLQGFLLAMAADLNTIPAELLTPSGFAVDSWKFGVGISARGDVGIVKGSAGLAAFVYLKPAKKPIANFTSEISNSDELSILEVNKDGSTAQTTSNFQRRTFRKGLSKALMMAGYFAKRGQPNPARKWAIYQIKAGFTLSTSGMLTLATIGGSTEAEVALKRLSL